MSKNARSLDAIAGDIHKLERSSMFDIGALLIEAKESCEHGEWLPWVDAEFDWSEDTAERYMASARLAKKSARVRNLKVPARTIYDLAIEPDDPDLPAIIDALAKATKGKQKLTYDEADMIIYFAKLRIKHGDFPDATLRLLPDYVESCPYGKQVIAALKTQKPTTDEAAAKITVGLKRAYVAELYAPHGKLPEVPDDALDYLDRVPEEQRAKVLAALQALPGRLTAKQIFKIAMWPDEEPPEDEDEPPAEDEDEQSEDEQEPEQEAKPATPLPRELLEAFNIVLSYARKPAPTAVNGITGPELMEVTNYIGVLHKIITGGSHVKSAADRAEARSKMH